MYIFKNAFRNTIRSKGRNLLIGIIVLVIATSSCVALSVKQASVTAKEEALSGIKITAQISIDRDKLIKKADRDNQAEFFKNIASLDISDLKKYAKAESVEDFYYSISTAMNKSGKLEPVDTTGVEREDDDTSSSKSSSFATSSTSKSSASSVKSTTATSGLSVAWLSTNQTSYSPSILKVADSSEVASPEAASSEATSSEELTSSAETSSAKTASSGNTSSEDNGYMPGSRGNFSGGNQSGGNKAGGNQSGGNKAGGNMGGGPAGGNASGNSGSSAFGGMMGSIMGGEVNRDAFIAGFMGRQGDFVVTGYSSLSAMTDFINKTKQITSGNMFDFNTADKVCIISSELATLNNLKVGNTIKLENPNNEDEIFKFKIVGIYTDSQAGETESGQLGGFSTAQDSANQIYTSYKVLNKIIKNSEKNAKTETEEDTGRTSSTALRKQESGTYVFASEEDFNKFESEARALGLSDDYKISSSDLENYKESAQPLEELGKYAGYFVLIVLAIGAIILVVLNIFNIRERKYEIGVLAAIGMKKRKISLQFLTEIFIVTFIFLIIGTGIGATVSLPITNALLENKVSSQTSQQEQQGSMPRLQRGGFIGATTNYITQVSSATNFKVIMKLMLVGVILTLAAGCVAIISVLRYDPLKILTLRE